MSNIKIDNYKAFFADQIKESVIEQQKINRSTMRQLFRSGDLSLAYVETIQRETGMVILISTTHGSSIESTKINHYNFKRSFSVHGKPSFGMGLYMGRFQ